MYQVDNDVVLLDPDTIEVFPYRERELFLRLPLLPIPADHRRRLEADATGPRKDEVVVGLGKGGGGVEFVFAAVRVEEPAVDGVPLDLYYSRTRQSRLLRG